MAERMRAVSIDVALLARSYFYFDTPVPFQTKTGTVHIKPVALKDSEIFLSSVGLLNIDKNSLPNAKIIQMSYLQFVCQVLLSGDAGKFNRLCLYNILYLCLGMERPEIKWRNERSIFIYDKDTGIEISAKEFDEIRRIIMYQNFPHFDDDYINPELKEAMDEVDELKNKGKDMPNLERRMAIITAHSGLPKREQQEMSYRSHSLLFEEVCGEVEFTTVRPAYLLSHSKEEFDHWIFKKHKDKLDGYIKSIDSYQQSMGGANNIRSTDTSLGDSYIQEYNNFKQ